MSNRRPSLISASIKCSCKGYSLDKLLQPQILVMLAQRSMHGYLIIQELEARTTSADGKADHAGVYRAIKALEDKGMVRFDWITDQAGPARKNYMMTDKGLECLGHWIKTLEDYQVYIARLLDEARTVAAEDILDG